ncbi:conserved Plasmodium protein, unknown function [Plasmodium reichenowi]|uniref:Uncharacterized protein n=1 Tax=Plasmodium reichenowi TaxID=5854 RepID=A0A2P9DD56_PLARE|nr:conserved Plasmodium protein, unknown function [Plasmodium reichenowi]
MDGKIKCNIKLKRLKKDDINENLHKINEHVLNIFKKKEEDEENEIKDEERIEHIKCIKEGKILIDVEKQKENSKDHLYLNFLNNLENKLNRIQNKKEIIYLNFPKKCNNNNNNIKNNMSDEYDHHQDVNSSIHSNDSQSSERDSDIEIRNLSSFIIHKDKNNLKLNKEKENGKLENNIDNDNIQDNNQMKTQHQNFDHTYNMDDTNNDDISTNNLTHIYNVTEKNLTFKRKILLDKFNKHDKEVLIKNEINLYDDFKEHNIEIENYGKYILKKMGYKEDVYNEYINKYYNEYSEQNYFDKIYNNLQSRDFRFTGVGAEEEMKQNMENIKKGDSNHELKGEDTHKTDDSDYNNDKSKICNKYDESKKYNKYYKSKICNKYDKSKICNKYDKSKICNKYDESKKYNKSNSSYSSTSKRESSNTEDRSLNSLDNQDNSSYLSDNPNYKTNKHTKDRKDKYKLTSTSNSTNSSHNNYDYIKKKTNNTIEEHKYSSDKLNYDNNDKNYVFFKGLIVKINLETHEFYKRKGIVLYKIKKEKAENGKKTKNTHTYIYGLLIFKHYKYILPYKHIIKDKLKNMEHNFCTQQENKDIWTHFINQLNIKNKSYNHNNYSDHHTNQQFHISQIKSNYLETTINQDVRKCKIVNKNLKHPVKEENLYKEIVELKKIKSNHAYVQIRKKYIMKVSLDDVCQYV